VVLLSQQYVTFFKILQCHTVKDEVLVISVTVTVHFSTLNIVICRVLGQFIHVAVGLASDNSVLLFVTPRNCSYISC